MNQPLRSISFEAVTTLEYALFVDERDLGAWRRPMLVVRFEGTYRIGSEGNPDADFMRAIQIAAIEFVRACAVVIDLSTLRYEWGDSIGQAIGVVPERGLPFAVVVGDGCREALRTLPFWPRSAASKDEVMFESLDTALDYAAAKVRARKHPFWDDAESANDDA